ncbi:MAG: putative molybdenum carrier protein [Pirellulaceae bacterium]|nr:putative molybdenum carrier protein [Pirellulaceae bacterium]
MEAKRNTAQQATKVCRIVSGGQTGVDQAALQVAIELRIEHGGWCPRGRICEAGTIPKQFFLRETQSAKYSVRTEKNVIDSDGTLILYRDQLSGGTALTQRMAMKHQRPLKIIDLSTRSDFDQIHQWLLQNKISCLNVAGPRESTAIGIGAQSQRFLQQLLRHELP